MTIKLPLTLLILLATLLASGCDQEPPKETVFDDQIEALDKARAVEDELQKRAEELDRKLKEEGEDDSPD